MGSLDLRAQGRGIEKLLLRMRPERMEMEGFRQDEEDTVKSRSLRRLVV